MNLFYRIASFSVLDYPIVGHLSNVPTHLFSFFKKQITTLGVVLFLLMGLQTQAAVYYVKPTATGAGTGATWADASNDLQGMINASAAGDQVWVAAGTYLPTLDMSGLVPTNVRTKTFLMQSGVSVYGGFEGTETAWGQRNWRVNPTILSGDLGTLNSIADNAYHVVLVNAPTAPTILDGFTITGGNANGSGTFLTNVNGNRNGGGIYTYGGGTFLNLNNLSIVNNNVATFGGGIYNNTNASPTITNVALVGNNSGVYGGGICNDGSCAPTIINATIANNTATNLGAGIFNLTSSNAVIKNCIIWGNTQGGVISSIGNNTSTPIVTYSDIQQGSGVFTGTGNINANPVFFSSNLIGPDGIWMTADDGLQIGCSSPCINTGNNTTAPTTDILGNSIFAITRDMGAYESQGTLGIPLPTVATTQSFCTSNTVANLVATGAGTINWYATPTGGTALAITMPLTTTTYYVSQTLSCGESDRIAVGVTVLPSVAVVYVDWSKMTSGDGSTWATAFKTLQEGINAPCVVQVWVRAGTYFPTLDINGLVPTDSRTKTFLIKSGVGVYGGFAGTETAWSQRNWRANPTILSGDLGATSNTFDNAYHVVVASAPIAPTNLDGFTITDGNADGSGTFLVNPNGNRDGGGIYTFGGGTNLSLNNLSIVKCSASDGGAMFNTTNSSPTITNVVITGNSSSYGAGIYNDVASTPTLLNTTIVNNTAVYSAGGIHNSASSNAIIKNCIVWGNTDGNGVSSISNSASTPIVTYSDIQQSSGVYTGTGNINSNPQFFNLSNLKGADGVWMTADDGLQITCASPCANTGNNTNAPTTDILGNSIYATTRDMGAYENQGNFVALPTVATTQSLCASNTIANLVATGTGTINWYATSTGGAALASTTPLTTTTYYVAQTVACGESNRLAVAVTVFPNVAVAYVDGAKATSGDGLTWATAFKSLQEAINYPCVVQVWVKAGTYFPTLNELGLVPTNARSKTFLMKSGVSVYGGFAGTETALSQRNWSTRPTILSGDLGTLNSNADNVYHVVVVNAPTLPINLDGFTVTGGTANSSGLFLTNSTGNNSGGGIYSLGGGTNLSLTNLSIVNNSAGSGGGIYNISNSSPTIINGAIIGNSARYGGAIYNEATASPTFLNTTIVNNTATALAGGMYSSQATDIIFKNCILWGNTEGANMSSIVNNSGVPTVTYSDIQQSSGVHTGTGNINANPVFVSSTPIGADGLWMTPDDGVQLGCTSPCINTGDNTNAPTTDILGNSISATTKDMGAYESQIICPVLPIELLSFTGRHTDKGNLLTWITATEINNKGYQIERAPQPPKGTLPMWEILGFVNAKGNAATYEFTDKAPSGGWGLYRLRQMDNDGKETLSKTISIQNSGGKGLKVYPSVSTDVLTVETAETGGYHIFNLLGQQVLNGKTGQLINVSNLPQGTYIVRVGVEQAKFVKQ